MWFLFSGIRLPKQKVNGKVNENRVDFRFQCDSEIDRKKVCRLDKNRNLFCFCGVPHD